MTTPTATSSPSPVWSSPERISDRVGSLALAIDNSGHPHLAVASHALFQLTNDTGVWTSERIDRPPTDWQDADPSIALDNDDTAYVTFTQLSAGEFGIFQKVFTSARLGGGWSKAALVSNDAWSPTIIVRNGSVHLAYDEFLSGDAGCEPGFELLPTHYESGAYGSMTTETVAPDGASSLMALASDGTPRVISHAACTDPDYWWYADGSSGAFVVKKLPVVASSDRPAALLVDSAAVTRVVFVHGYSDREGTEIAYTTLTDSGWSQPFSLIADAWAADATVDSRDAVHIAALGTDGVIYSTNRSGDFVSTVLATPSLDEGSNIAIAVDAAGRPHIAYTTHEPLGLWYAVGSGY